MYMIQKSNDLKKNKNNNMRFRRFNFLILNYQATIYLATSDLTSSNVRIDLFLVDAAFTILIPLVYMLAIGTWKNRNKYTKQGIIK